MMKALTYWQPWASLVVLGAKPWEFRRWPAPASIVGQRIVIHAGARPIKRAEVDALVARLKDPELAPLTGLDVDRALAVLCHLDAMPLSAGIGTAIVGQPIEGMAAAKAINAMLFNDSDRHEHSNWAWPMLEVEAWEQHVPMRGSQGFWNWPTPEDAAL